MRACVCVGGGVFPYATGLNPDETLDPEPPPRHAAGCFVSGSFGMFVFLLQCSNMFRFRTRFVGGSVSQK